VSNKKPDDPDLAKTVAPLIVTPAGPKK